MAIYLGNLTVGQLEKTLGIALDKEAADFLSSTWQANASSIHKDKWHCFDMPLCIACGSKEMAAKAYEILRPYSEQMNAVISIQVFND